MAVSVKVKPVAAKKPALVKSPTAIIVDRVVQLKNIIDSVAEEAKEYKKLTDQLRQQAMEQAPDQDVIFEGTTHDVVFTECSKEREIADMAKVKKALGNEMFLKVASVTLADLDRYLTPEEVAKLVNPCAGSRRIKIREKP